MNRRSKELDAHIGNKVKITFTDDDVRIGLLEFGEPYWDYGDPSDYYSLAPTRTKGRLFFRKSAVRNIKAFGKNAREGAASEKKGVESGESADSTEAAGTDMPNSNAGNETRPKDDDKAPDAKQMLNDNHKSHEVCVIYEGEHHAATRMQMLTPDGKPVRTLTEALRFVPDSMPFCVGSGTSFLFIGTKDEFNRDIGRINQRFEKRKADTEFIRFEEREIMDVYMRHVPGEQAMPVFLIEGSEEGKFWLIDEYRASKRPDTNQN